MLSLSRVIVLSFLTLFLFACDADTPTETETDQLSLKGELSYRERIALPAGSQATITLESSAKTDSASAVVSKKEIKLGDKQVPIPFELTLFRDQIQPQTQHLLNAELVSPDGTTLWHLEQPLLVNLNADQSDLGTLLLTQPPVTTDSKAKQASFDCGQQVITVRFTEGYAELEIGTDRYVLEQVVAASGAKYESTDGEVMFWNKGDKARIEMNGAELPECIEVNQQNLLPFEAHGQHADWSMTASETRVEWKQDNSAKPLVFTMPDIVQVGNQLTIQANSAGQSLNLTATDTLCHDDHGRVYPLTLTGQLNTEKLTGCGGDSQAVLTNKEWVVEDINQQGIIDMSRITLNFDNNGRVAGLASCNQFSASYALSPTLNITEIISTKKACAPALMDQEQQFLDILETVSKMDIDNHGALIMSTQDGKKLTARLQ